MPRTVIQPDSLKDPRPRYSQGILTDGGRLLFIAGQTAADRDGNVVGKDDAEKQAEQVFANLGAVLAAAGGSFDNLVSTTTYLTDIKYREAYNKVRLKYLREQSADQYAGSRQGARRRRFPDRDRRDRRHLRRSGSSEAGWSRFDRWAACKSRLRPTACFRDRRWRARAAAARQTCPFGCSLPWPGRPEAAGREFRRSRPVRDRCVRA